ncbi:MAG: hypothetical protein MZW92_69380 [Comamonadaceae bacterium]|nr:hypothetical protein [Comamonadaceae bacterium]
MQLSASSAAPGAESGAARRGAALERLRRLAAGRGRRAASTPSTRARRRPAATTSRRWPAAAAAARGAADARALAARDVAGVAALAEVVTGTMTALAEAGASSGRWRSARARCRRSAHGVPLAADGTPQDLLDGRRWARAAARELNVSSDLDLIYVYDEDGETARTASSPSAPPAVEPRVLRAARPGALIAALVGRDRRAASSSASTCGCGPTATPGPLVVSGRDARGVPAARRAASGSASPG